MSIVVFSSTSLYLWIIEERRGRKEHGSLENVIMKLIQETYPVECRSISDTSQRGTGEGAR